MKQFIVREFNNADTMAGWLNAISESNEVRILNVTPIPSDPNLQDFRVLITVVATLKAEANPPA